MSQDSPDPKPSSRRRRRRFARVCKWTAVSVLALLLLLFGFAGWVVATPSGTAFAWHRLRGHLPAAISVGSVQGALLGDLQLENVAYQSGGTKAHIASIDVDLAASDLLDGVLHIRHLDISGVDYRAGKSGAAANAASSGPLSLPQKIHLPVAVRIDRLALIDVTAVTAPQAQPIRIDRLLLTHARLDNRQWRIGSLAGHGPLFDLHARAHLTPRHGYPLALHARVKLRLPGYAPIAAKADIGGDLADLTLKAQLASPYNLSFDGQIRHALKTPTVHATLHVKQLTTAAVSAKLPPLTAGAELQADGPVDDLGLKLSANVDSSRYGKARLAGTLHYTPQKLVIDKLALAVPATHGSLKAKGRIALGGHHNPMQLSVGWTHLGWPLVAHPTYTSDHGKLHLSGTRDAYRLRTSLAWRVAGKNGGTLSALGAGSMQAFDLKTLQVSGGPGDIHGHAHLRWSPKLVVAAHLQGRHINPGAVVSGLPGDFDLRADLSARQAGHGYRATIKDLHAHGSLRHQPLSLDAKARYLGNQVVVDTFHLAYAGARADLSGHFGWQPTAKLDGHWAVHAPKLSRLWPSLAGQLSTRGRLGGRVDAPDIHATLSARKLAAYGGQVQKAHLHAAVDWSGHSDSHLDLALDGVHAAGQAIQRLALQVDGTPGAHRASLSLDSATAKAALAMAGSFDKKSDQEHFKLEKLRAAYGKLAPWTLAKAATGTVSAHAQSLDKTCLTSQGARLCLRGQHDAKASTGHITLSDFPYDYAKPFFPQGLQAKGTVSGKIDARLPSSGLPVVKVDLNTSAGTLSMRNPQGARVQVLSMQPGHIQARMAANGLNAQVDLPLSGNNGVHARASVAQGSGSLASHALNGSLHIGLSSMQFLTKLSPEIDTFDGHLSGDMRFAGTAGAPRVLGQIGLDASKIALVTPGLTVTHVHVGAKGQGRHIVLDAKAHSGGGSLKAEGDIVLGRSGQTLHLSLTGDHFQIVHIPDVTAYVSPDLKVSVAPKRVDVKGSVTIPQAAITPRNLPAAGVTTASSDQVIVTHKSRPAQAVSRAIHADVNVILGNKVHIKGFGLSADLGGKLRVVQQPGNQPTGTGAINITNGSYKAYGQNLDIEKGKILFAGGPVSQPGIDIKAVRHPTRTVTVGVQISGSLRKPNLNLFSDPSMTQSEQLSWLLLGRPLNSAGGQQSSLIERAALALGSSRGNQVLNNLGDKLGLKVGIGESLGTKSSEAALTVGKYLSPRLYVGYGLGLFDQVSTVTMRYTLSSHWKLETQSSGVATGGDIVWTFVH